MFPWRNWCLWTNYKHTNPSFVHSFDFKISCSMAPYPSNYSMGWLPLDCCPRYFHQCGFFILYWRGFFHLWYKNNRILFDYWGQTFHFSNFNFNINFEPFKQILRNNDLYVPMKAITMLAWNIYASSASFIL